MERLRHQEAAWGPTWTWKCSFREYVHRSGLQLDYSTLLCYGEVHGHEILKRSRAGSTDENLLDIEGQTPLCNKHNSLVETEPRLAHELGLAKHAWEL